MRILLFLLIIGSSFVTAVKAQIRPPFMMDSVPNHVIKLSLLNFVDPSGANLELGYERKFSQNYSLQLSAAYVLNRTNLFFSDDFDALSGFKLKLEGKQYIRYNFPLKQYFAAEITYHYQKEEGREFYFEACNSCYINRSQMDNFYIDTINIIRNYSALHFKYGFQKIFSDQIALDFFIGLGIKYRHVSHQKRRHKEDNFSDEEYFYYPVRRNEEGSTFVLSLPFNIKLGYWF